jgi:hypothetical protein
VFTKAEGLRRGRAATLPVLLEKQHHPYLSCLNFRAFPAGSRQDIDGLPNRGPAMNSSITLDVCRKKRFDRVVHSFRDKRTEAFARRITLRLITPNLRDSRSS